MWRWSAGLCDSNIWRLLAPVRWAGGKMEVRSTLEFTWPSSQLTGSELLYDQTTLKVSFWKKEKFWFWSRGDYKIASGLQNTFIYFNLFFLSFLLFHLMATGYNVNISYPTFSIASNVGIQIFVQFEKKLFDRFSKVRNDMNYYGI